MATTVQVQITSIRDLSASIRAYRDQLVTLDRNSKEYRETVRQLGAAQSQLNDINSAARAASSDLTQQFARATRAAAGVAGGFSAAAGAMSLFGVESDAVGETLVKLQSLQSIVTGVNSFARGISSARVALAAFNTTLLTSPLFILAATFTAIAIAVGVFLNNMAEAASGVDELRQSQDELNRSIEFTTTELDFEIRLMRAKGAEATNVIQIQRAVAREEIALREANIDSLYQELQVLEQRTLLWGSASRRRRNALREEYAEQQTLVQQAYDRLTALNSDFTVAEIQEDVKRQEQRRTSAERAAQEALRAQQAAQAEALKLRQQFQQELSNIDRQAAEIAYNAIVASLDDPQLLALREEEIANNELRLQQLQVLIDSENTATATRIQAAQEYQQVIEQNLTFENEAEALRNQIAQNEALRVEQQIELAARLQEATNPQNLTPEEQIQQLYAESEAQLEIAEDVSQSYEERTRALNAYMASRQAAQTAEQRLAQAERRTQDQALSVTADALATGAQLLGENTAIGKTLAIAGATISTYQAAANALRDIPTPFNYVAMATTIAAGLLQVRQIMSVQVPGSNNNGGPSISAPAIPSMPELQNPIQETHNNLDAYDREEMNRPQRVYVLESDITQAQNRVNVAESEATF